MLEVDVAKRLGDFTLAARFTSGPGVTALFGRSGAGKTSVVNMIAGLLRPERGHIRVADRTLFDANAGIDVPTRRRRIGYVFQDGLLFPHLSVRQNLDYGRRMAGRAEAQIPFDQVVELLGINHLLARRPSTFVGRRKAARRHRPRPAGGVRRCCCSTSRWPRWTRRARPKSLPYIERLRDEMGLPIIYVSHSLDEITRLADTVVIMANGGVAAAGPVEQVMARLDVAAIADPIDAGAVVAARVTAHDDEFELTTLAFQGGDLRLPRIAEPVGHDLRIRVLARDLILAIEPPHGLSIRNILSGRVIETSLGAGPFAMVTVDVGGTRLVARITRHAAGELALAPGKPVFVLIKSVALDRRPTDDDGASPPPRRTARPIDL